MAGYRTLNSGRRNWRNINNLTSCSLKWQSKCGLKDFVRLSMFVCGSSAVAGFYSLRSAQILNFKDSAWFPCISWRKVSNIRMTNVRMSRQNEKTILPCLYSSYHAWQVELALNRWRRFGDNFLRSRYIRIGYWNRKSAHRLVSKVSEFAGGVW